MPNLADYLLANTSGGNFGTMSPGEEAVAVTPGSVLSAVARGAMAGPSFASKAMEQSQRDRAAYARGGVPELMRDTQTAEDLGSGFVGGPLGIKAYHGSPHDFSAFDMSKIGTGEGAQAYGHGLYFAEEPKTAEAYRETLGNRQGHISYANSLLNRSDNDIDKAIALAKSPQFSTTGEGRAFGPEAIQYLEDLKTGKPQPRQGKTYEVNINADPKHFLDWDKPLSEQPTAYHDFINQAPWRKYMLTDAYKSRQLGEVDRNIQSPEYIEQLREAGIPGIKYLDQGSRLPRDVEAQIADLQDRIANSARHPANPEQAAAQVAADKEKLAKLSAPQTSNYVVFDDKLIDIIKKYGLAGALLGAGGMAARQGEQ